MAFRVGSIVADAKLDTKQWDSGSKKLLGSVTKVGAVIATALTAVMVKSVKAANEWQKSLSNVNTLLDETVISTQDMAMELLKLDSRLGSTTELTDAMYQAFSAGAEDMDEALAITTQSAKFAKAALTDTATAVDVITTAMNAYGDEVMDAELASDIFFTTIKQGKINGEQLAAVIGKSIPLFASLNVPLEELGAGIAAMTKQGVNAAEATTQLNGIMNSFIKPSTAMTEALEAQGFASGAAFIETEGLEGALQFLEEQTGGNADAIGELVPSIEAVRGVMALTGTGGEEFTKILEEMENASGSTQTAFEKQELTFETFRNQMDKTMLIVGNVGKAFVDDIAVGATKAGEGMTEFLLSSEGANKIAGVIAFLAGAFNLVKEVVKPLAEAILPELKDIFITTKESIEEIAGEGEDSLTVFDLLSGSVQLTASAFRVMSSLVQFNISVIGSLINAIKEGGKTLGTFRDFISGDATWDEVKEQGEKAADSVGAIITSIVEGSTDMIQTMATEVVSFSDRVGETSENMETAVTGAMDRTRDNVTENWAELITGQQDLNNELAEQTEEQLALLAQQQAEGTTIIETEIDKRLELLSGYLDDSLDLEEFNYKEKKEMLEDLYAENLITQEEYNAASEALEEERTKNLTEQIVGYANTAMDAVSTLLGFIESAGTTQRNEELAAIEANYDKQLEVLELRNKSENLNDIEYAKKKEELEKEKLAKQNDIKKKEFDSNKSWTIANIWLSASLAAVNAWAQNDWITALIVTGLVAAEAVAATSVAASQKFIPAKRTGGMASGMTRINEAGGEIVNLPDGSQVIPNDISQKIAGNVGGGMTVNNYFNGTQVRSEADIEMISNKVASKIARDMRTA